MRDRTGAACVSCNLGTPDLQRNDNNGCLAPNQASAHYANFGRSLHKGISLTHRRETRLSRVAQRTALIGSDRKAAAGT